MVAFELAKVLFESKVCLLVFTISSLHVVKGLHDTITIILKFPEKKIIKR